jgi:hypothetical protein
MELVEARTERSGESATPEEPEEAGHVLSMNRCGRQPMSPRLCVPVPQSQPAPIPCHRPDPAGKIMGRFVTRAIA